MLNKALWKLELDVPYRLRYFLRYFHQQILFEAEKRPANLSKMIVYHMFKIRFKVSLFNFHSLAFNFLYIYID